MYHMCIDIGMRAHRHAYTRQGSFFFRIRSVSMPLGAVSTDPLEVAGVPLGPQVA
jgi:hypothetical protein